MYAESAGSLGKYIWTVWPSCSSAAVRKACIQMIIEGNATWQRTKNRNSPVVLRHFAIHHACKASFPLDVVSYDRVYNCSSLASQPCFPRPAVRPFSNAHAHGVKYGWLTRLVCCALACMQNHALILPLPTMYTSSTNLTSEIFAGAAELRRHCPPARNGQHNAQTG